MCRVRAALPATLALLALAACLPSPVCGAGVWLTAGALVGRIAPRRLLAGAAALAAVFLFASVAFFL